MTYGKYARLARRCIESIRKNTDRSLYRLIVGGNAVCRETENYLARLYRAGSIDQLHISRRNINKCPMMRRMFSDIKTRYTCWFDDDSYVTARNALSHYVRIAQESPSSTVMWGQAAVCYNTFSFIDVSNVAAFVREAPWYNGLTPPSWKPGGKGEFDYQEKGTGDGRWLFITGGFWLIRTKTIRILDWPDRRLVKLGDDVLLGEAIRQKGWHFQNTGSYGVAISACSRRGDEGRLLPAK